MKGHSAFVAQTFQRTNCSRNTRVEYVTVMLWSNRKEVWFTTRWTDGICYALKCFEVVCRCSLIAIAKTSIWWCCSLSTLQCILFMSDSLIFFISCARGPHVGIRDLQGKRLHISLSVLSVTHDLWSLCRARCWVHDWLLQGGNKGAISEWSIGILL